MLFRSIFILTILLAFIFIGFVQSKQALPISSHQTKPKFPTIIDEEASQWLSPRSMPRRWRHQRIHKPSSETDQTLKQFHSLNDNGVRQFDTQSFEGVSMEVIFEMVYKQQSNPTSG